MFRPWRFAINDSRENVKERLRGEPRANNFQHEGSSTKIRVDRSLGAGQLTVAASSLGYRNRDGGEKGIRDARLVGGKAPVIARRSWLSRISDFL